MNDLIAFLLGFLSNFLTSILFLAFLRKIKPSVNISSSIAKGSSSQGQDEYMFKVVNLTARDIIDIKAELFLIQPFRIEGGFIREFEAIPLVRDSLMEIKGFYKARRDFTTYDFCFKTRDDIETKWQRDSNYFLLFRLQVTDSVSGFKQVFSKEYYSINNIKKGEFEIGQSMEIKI